VLFSFARVYISMLFMRLRLIVAFRNLDM